MASFALLTCTAMLLVHLVALALLAERWFPYALGKAVGLVLIVAMLFFVEHFYGLGNISWLTIFTVPGAIYLLWRARDDVCNIIAREIPFIVAFCYALVWRYLSPDLNVTTERFTDLYFVSNYMGGATLPPADHWYARAPFTCYYAFIHYAAAVMARFLRLPAGVACNLAFCVLTALTVSLVWEFSRSVSNGRKWVAPIVATTVMIGGTGAAPFVRWLVEIPASPEVPWFEHWQYSIASTRLAGMYDANATDAGRAVGLADGYQGKPKPYDEGGAKSDHPLEPFSSMYLLGDYHPPLGGFFVLALSMVVFIRLGSEARRSAAVLGFSLPFAAVINTWILPLQAVLVATWPIWLRLRHLRVPWIGLLLGLSAGCILFFPFLTYFASSGSPIYIRTLPAIERTTMSSMVVLHWPVLLLLAIGLVRVRKSTLGALLSALLAFCLVLSEMIYVDDPSGGQYERTNTVMKWWQWLYFLAVGGLAAVQLGAAGQRTTIAIISILVLTWSYAYDAIGYILTQRGPHSGQMRGDYWLVDGDPARRALVEYLQAMPDGVVLENARKDAYDATGALATFSGKPLVLGWLSHERTWRGFVDDLLYLYGAIQEFYRGKSASPQDFLKANNVAYVVWTEEESALHPESLLRLKRELAGQYRWVSFREDGADTLGLWVRKDL